MTKKDLEIENRDLRLKIMALESRNDSLNLELLKKAKELNEVKEQLADALVENSDLRIHMGSDIPIENIEFVGWLVDREHSLAESTPEFIANLEEIAQHIIVCWNSAKTRHTCHEEV